MFYVEELAYAIMSGFRKLDHLRIMIYVEVISQDEYGILVITRDHGIVEVEC